ncbi:MAG: LacI family DNA-binding transcriptional regulator [Acidimicrobiales bacterium]
MARPVRIADVARLAGVSTATVSNAVNRPRVLAPDTLARVQAAIEQLGYVPHGTARQLRTGRSGLVGVVVPDLDNGFWCSAVTGVETWLAARGVGAVVATSRYDWDRERDAIAQLLDLGVDGLVLGTLAPDRHAADYATLPVPTVTIARQGRRAGLASVSLDEAAAMALALDHLVELGHRRMVFARSGGDQSWTAERRRGLAAAVRLCHRRGIELDIVDVVVPMAVPEHGADVVDEVLAMQPRPTAVLCANDFLAIGVLGALAVRRVRVPAEMSVVGVDDLDLASLMSPPLTTVRQDTGSMGAVAAAWVHDGMSELRNVLLAPSLVERATTAPPGLRPTRPAPRGRVASGI